MNFGSWFVVQSNPVLYPLTIIMTMKTFWAWKHSINNSEKNKSGYTKILARDMNSAYRKAHKHYKHHMCNSDFNVSVMSGETDKHGYAKEAQYSTGKWTRKAWSTYKYFHSLEPEMQERVHNHYKEFGDDWKGQDKTDLRFLVALLRQEK